MLHLQRIVKLLTPPPAALPAVNTARNKNLFATRMRVWIISREMMRLEDGVVVPLRACRCLYLRNWGLVWPMSGHRIDSGISCQRQDH